VKRNILASFVVLLTGILIFGSCNKIDTTDLGNELIPGSDNVETLDTTIYLNSDNLLTPATDTIKMLYTELHTAGVIDNDLEFGKTETHFYTSFVTSQSHTYPFVKKDTVRIDSVVLSLGFNQLYGDSNSVENFEVREIFTGFQFKDTGYQIDNPDLPGTRSEMALPLNFRGETIGVLDVQSIQPGAFTADDASTLSILADQIAIAIENARLFGQTQRAREEAENLYNQFLRTEWKTFLRRDAKVGYRQTVSGGQALQKPIEREDIRGSRTDGPVLAVEGAPC